MRAIRPQKYKSNRNLARKLGSLFASDLYESPSWQGILSSKLETMGKRGVEQFLHRLAEELYDTKADPLEVADQPIGERSKGFAQASASDRRRRATPGGKSRYE